MKSKKEHFCAARQSRKKAPRINPRPQRQGRAASFTTTRAARPFRKLHGWAALVSVHFSRTEVQPQSNANNCSPIAGSKRQYRPNHTQKARIYSLSAGFNTAAFQLVLKAKHHSHSPECVSVVYYSR